MCFCTFFLFGSFLFMGKGALQLCEVWIKMPPFAGADTTPYASKGYVVEPQFRAMLHAEGVPQDLRMRLAEMKIKIRSKLQ